MRSGRPQRSVPELESLVRVIDPFSARGAADHAPALTRERGDYVVQEGNAVVVEAVLWLVQKNEARLVEERHGQTNTLSLAHRESIHPPADEFAEVERPDCLSDHPNAIP